MGKAAAHWLIPGTRNVGYRLPAIPILVIFILLDFKINTLCVHMWVHAIVYMRTYIRDNLWESALSIYHVGPGDRTQAAGLETSALAC